MRRSVWLFAAVVAAVALAIRLLHLLPFAAATPFFDPAPWNTPDNPLDPGEYDRWGMQIAHGDLWWTDHGQGEYFQSPVYPYLVALVYLLAGGRSFYAVAVLQMVLGALTCACIGLTARRLLSPAAGWIAAGAATAYAPSIFYASFLLKEPLATFLLAAALLLTVSTFGAAASERLAGRWAAYLGTGVVWGAAVAAWPLLAPVAATVLAWAVWQIRAAPQAGSKRVTAPRPSPGMAAAAGLLACGVLLAVLPCTVRNVVGEGRFVLISDAGPRNWEVGNSANSTGTYIDFPRQALSPVTPAFWRLFSRKIGLFLRAAEIPQVTDLELLRHASPVLRLPLPALGLLAPFALVGMVLGWRRRGLFPLHAVGVLYPLAVALFFVVGRFRLPWLPAVAFFAALAADEIRGAARRATPAAARWRAAVAAAAILALGFILNTPRPLPVGAYPFHHAYARYYLEVGQVAMINGRGSEALVAYGQALQVPSPRYRSAARQGRAAVYLGQLQRPDLALEELRHSLEENPRQNDAGQVRELIHRLEAQVPPGKTLGDGVRVE